MSKTLKFTNVNFHQGDTQWFAIESIPDELNPPVKKQFVASSGRSGSFHALFGDYTMHPYNDGFIVNAHEDLVLNHSLQRELEGITMDEVKVLPKKDHHATVIPKGIYYTKIQRRMNPLSGIQEKVKD